MEDLSGKKFGMLTVLSFKEKKKNDNGGVIYYWNCICDCGKKRTCNKNKLKDDSSVSCGCQVEKNREIRKKDKRELDKIYKLGKEEQNKLALKKAYDNNLHGELLGREFGRLKVLELDRYEIYRNRIKSYWKCECLCGRNIILSCNFTTEFSRKRYCGKCDNKRPRGNPLTIIKKGIFGEYERDSKIRSLEFLLNKDDFFLFLEEDCFYCGCGPNARSRTVNGNKEIYYLNGVDRVDSSLGYTKENCVSCCSKCNSIKGDLGWPNFVKWVSGLCGNINKIKEHAAINGWEDGI